MNKKFFKIWLAILLGFLLGGIFYNFFTDQPFNWRILTSMLVGVLSSGVIIFLFTKK